MKGRGSLDAFQMLEAIGNEVQDYLVIGYANGNREVGLWAQDAGHIADDEQVSILTCGAAHDALSKPLLSINLASQLSVIKLNVHSVPQRVPGHNPVCHPDFSLEAATLLQLGQVLLRR